MTSNMKLNLRILIPALLLIAAYIMPTDASAQGRPSKRERTTWIKEMQMVKTDYIAKKLDLSDEQKAKFIPLYNAMDAEIRKAQQDQRTLCTQVNDKDGKASDLEYTKAAEAAYELKGVENAIEMRYFKEFKTILTPKQLFKLRDAEQSFTRKLMKEHRKVHKD